MIREIKADPVLRAYGLALAFTHALTLWFWRSGDRLLKFVEDPVAICWSFAPSCAAWRPFWRAAFEPAFAAYAVATLAALVAFTIAIRRPRWTEAAWGALAIATLLKLVLYTVDYREMGNYHYMPNLVLLAFLFWPAKREAIPWLIVAFYLGAGVLKLNHEWLSGSALFNQPILSGPARVVACYLVVWLELIVSPLLLSRRYFWWAFSAFAVFHLFSWHIVGFFYPLIMFALLSIFVLGRPIAARVRASTVGLLVLFALMQVPPYLAKTDSALTGEGRLTALNMFDARAVCQTHVWVRTLEDGVPTLTDIERPFPELGMRIRCEPWVYEQYARALCATGALEVGLDILGRRSSSPDFKVLRHQNATCY